MGIEYEIEILDWPSRFLVSSDELDRDQQEFYPDDPTIYPHLVDLDELKEGECTCRDFRFNVLPFLDEPDSRSRCTHIIQVQKYKSNHDSKPKKLPRLL